MSSKLKFKVGDILIRYKNKHSSTFEYTSNYSKAGFKILVVPYEEFKSAKDAKLGSYEYEDFYYYKALTSDPELFFSSSYGFDYRECIEKNFVKAGRLGKVLYG